MAGPRFFGRRGSFSLEFPADAAGRDLDAETDRRTLIRDVAALDLADPDGISFFAELRNAGNFTQAAAGACLVARRGVPPATRLVRVERPHLASARVASRFYPEPPLEPEIDPSATVDASASVGEGSRIAESVPG